MKCFPKLVTTTSHSELLHIHGKPSEKVAIFLRIQDFEVTFKINNFQGRDMKNNRDPLDPY